MSLLTRSGARCTVPARDVRTDHLGTDTARRRGPTASLLPELQVPPRPTDAPERGEDPVRAPSIFTHWPARTGLSLQA